MLGPILASWGFGATVLACQARFTDWAQLERDAAAVFSLLPADAATALAGHKVLALFPLVWVTAMSYSFFVMQSSFAPQKIEGTSTPKQVPLCKAKMVKHRLAAVDVSYMALNSLCMPGLFYHYICLMRTWGLDFAVPPMFGIYPDPPFPTLLTETTPQLVAALSVYMLSYEFIYYWWHRAMHEVPVLYKWVHKHHHQQTYPDRAAIDTFNTGCIESQIGLYLQLAVLSSWGELGLANLPGGIWFFTIAGYLSVLEHDSYERALPFDLWRADDHHMHHAYFSCNYSPYSVLWDKVFGTHKPFAVRGAEGESAAEQQRRRASFERSARPLRAPAAALSKIEDAPIATTLGSAVERGAVGAAALGVAVPPVAPTSCASATTLAAAAATTLAATAEPPALKSAASRSRSAGPSMSLGSGAGPNGEQTTEGEPSQQWDEQTTEGDEQTAAVDEQTAAWREGMAERLEGLLYDPIADDAELAPADEHEGRGETAEQGERALTEKQLETAEVVARLEGLLRVRSPTQASKRLAKLAHITNPNDEYGGETAVLMRGLVVALIYGGLFISMFAAP